MGKHKWIISIFLVNSLIGLSGCTEKTTNDSVVAQNSASKQKNENRKSSEKSKKKTVIVNVIDPETKQIIKSFSPKELGYGIDDSKYKQDIENWAKTTARGTENTLGYDQRMIPDKLNTNGQIIKGKPRRILDEAVLSEKIFETSKKGGNVELPLITNQSGYAPEDVQHLNEAAVASYTTRFNPAVTGRNRNIELSAQAINNVIVGKLDIFSFNTTVGPSDQTHGYQPAKEAVNGKLVDGIGGGICQTSSTLYNAVDQLKVSYVEKHHHSVHVGYVPVGRDATVSYGGPDFRFQNSTGVPLIIKTYIDKVNGTLTVEIRTSNANMQQLKR